MKISRQKQKEKKNISCSIVVDGFSNCNNFNLKYSVCRVQSWAWGWAGCAWACAEGVAAVTLFRWKNRGWYFMQVVSTGSAAPSKGERECVCVCLDERERREEVWRKNLQSSKKISSLKSLKCNLEFFQLEIKTERRKGNRKCESTLVLLNLIAHRKLSLSLFLSLSLCVFLPLSCTQYQSTVCRCVSCVVERERERERESVVPPLHVCCGNQKRTIC